MKIGVLLAAGQSRRFGEDKLFAYISDKPVIYHSLKLLHDACDKIFIACNAKNKKKIVELVHIGQFKKIAGIFFGGKTRFESVKKIVEKIPFSFTSKDILIIHNAANPYATSQEIAVCLRTLQNNTIFGVAPGRASSSTIKKVSHNLVVQETYDRKKVWEVETPQVVRAADFLYAIKKIKKPTTDDLAILETMGMRTALIPASPENRKITYKQDLPRNFLIGIGEDSHRFRVEGTGFRMQGVGNGVQKLGAVGVKNIPKIEANSDGDVIIHALCNAIASALGEGSLGTYADALCKKGVRDSTHYLKKILGKMKQRNYKIYNCSISVEAMLPRMDPLVPAMKKNLSSLLSISPLYIGITATSGEKLSSFGRGEGVKCNVAVLLQSS